MSAAALRPPAGPVRAVLYVCAVRSPGWSLAELRAKAEREGLALVAQHGYHLVATVSDPCGKDGPPVPQLRVGWLRVRRMVEGGEVDIVIARWPDVLSPDHEVRYQEVDYLRRHDCRMRYSYAPAMASTGGGATR
ncbi:hypothetical protein [Streptomyces sp. NPDC053427]|uniref:hypothetical protein n=1 Tax=Streptomyces sp. NPDC053427 TaxID=3365701 RepID=UPI0037D57959